MKEILLKARFNGARNSYTYKSTFDVKPDDYVVVMTPSNGYQVVQVVELIDETDYDGPIRSLVCKVEQA